MRHLGSNGIESDKEIKGQYIVMVIHVQDVLDNLLRLASVGLDLMITPFSISTLVSLFYENLLTHCRSLKF
jgi:hypothetical protein